MLIVGAYRQQVDNRFADSEIFAFLGPMHIEQAGLSAHGLLIKGTGLDSIIESSALTTIGLVTALCDANSIKKARYTIQVVSCTFYKLLRKAFEESSYSEDEFDEWLRHMKKNTSFKYWYNVLRLEKNILLLVRSLRQSNFLLFISTLQHLAPMFFTLDRIHYSRWMSVFIQDLLCLPEKNPALFQQFMSGSFTVNRTAGPFNGMAYDQCHEQNNRTVKAKNGYIDLPNKEEITYLKKLELALPEI